MMNRIIIIGIIIVVVLILPASAITLTNSTNGSYSVATFNGTGTMYWTVPDGLSAIKILVVAGGGGGGGCSGSLTNYGAGGGGAGGVLYNDSYSVTSGVSIAVTIGAGGSGGVGAVDGTSGGNSSFSTITVSGGGGGAKVTSAVVNGKNGGSGGGGARTGLGGSGVSGQGYAGGNASSNGGGGGGGASELGAAGNLNNGGDGGDGSTYLSLIVGGGGGGAARAGITYTPGAGGTGGGGMGASSSTGAAVSGTDDTGGGGGGAYYAATTGGDGGDGIVRVEYELNPVPVAAFSANITSGAAPLTVAFTDSSSNTPTSWAWSFDDGGANSTDQNPIRTFNSAGVYTITLTATNDGGSDTEEKVDYITVCDVSVAAFSANVTSGVAPLTVAFTDSSSNTPTSWAWSFDDGGANSTDQNPTRTFNSAGVYTITLTATNCGGSDTEMKVDYIVAATLSAFPGCSSVPTDIDADGYYEDINGNGRLDYSDLILFFTYIEWAKTNEPVSLFDFANDGGTLTYADVIALFQEM